jgi:hypothetical protein
VYVYVYVCVFFWQYTAASDPEFAPLVCDAESFLFDRSRVNGGKATWQSTNMKRGDGKRDYHTYHASYCAAIGLLDYDFSLVQLSLLFFFLCKIVFVWSYLSDSIFTSFKIHFILMFCYDVIICVLCCVLFCSG